MFPNLIVPVLTRYDLLQQLLDSVDVDVRNLLVVDNGKGHPLRFSDRFQLVHHLRMPANFGVAGSWNLGIQSFPFDRCWFICSDDVSFAPGVMKKWQEVSSPDHVVISSEWPHWQFFSVGERVIETVGLFDANFFPANFEDDDFARRCSYHKFEIIEFSGTHNHVKQGTVFDSRVAGENAKTYPRNRKRFHAKVAANDFGAGDWSLQIRRDNHWRVQ